MYHIARLGAVISAAYIAITQAAFAGTVAPIKVPEPTTMAVFAVGAGAVALAKFRRRRK